MSPLLRRLRHCPSWEPLDSLHSVAGFVAELGFDKDCGTTSGAKQLMQFSIADTV
jgi:hypothetical protein